MGEIRGFQYTLVAASEMDRYTGVVIDSEGKASLPGADGVAIAGVLQHDVISGEPGAIRQSGITFMTTAGSVPVGSKVAVTAEGKAKAAENGDFIIGIAITGASAAGVRISVLLSNEGVYTGTDNDDNDENGGGDDDTSEDN